MGFEEEERRTGRDLEPRRGHRCLQLSTDGVTNSESTPTGESQPLDPPHERRCPTAVAAVQSPAGITHFIVFHGETSCFSKSYSSRTMAVAVIDSTVSDIAGLMLIRTVRRYGTAGDTCLGIEVTETEGTSLVDIRSSSSSSNRSGKLNQYVPNPAPRHRRSLSGLVDLDFWRRLRPSIQSLYVYRPNLSAVGDQSVNRIDFYTLFENWESTTILCAHWFPYSFTRTNERSALITSYEGCIFKITNFSIYL